MVLYFDDYDLACFDGYSFRRDKKTGYYLSSKKIDGRRKRLHVYVWEKYNGKVPKGYAVHHIDEDKRNNEPSNLTIITKKEHAVLHGETKSEEQRERMAENVVLYAMPKAKEWHGTEEGHKWHSEHGKEVMDNRPSVKYVCTYCGNEFETKHLYGKGSNTFCSNKCKAAYRRESGVDDVVKICEKCGGEYVANKYQKTKYCERCKHRRGRN